MLDASVVRRRPNISEVCDIARKMRTRTAAAALQARQLKAQKKMHSVSSGRAVVVMEVRALPHPRALPPQCSPTGAIHTAPWPHSAASMHWLPPQPHPATAPCRWRGA